MKGFAWVFGALCVVSAILQYNDPDPLVWMVIYGVSALASFYFALGKINYIVPFILGILLVIGFVYQFPDKFEGFEIGSGDIKNIEEGRESFGLLIMGLVMLTFSIWIRYQNRLKV
jgi:hypothetical protein